MNNKIFVKNLSKETTETMIKKFITEVGPAKSVTIFKETKFENPGMFALIEMDSRDDAEKAIRMLDRKELCGKNVSIIKADPIKIPKEK